MIPFSPPRIDEKIIEEVNDTLRSGWITTGPKTKKFEKELSEFCGAEKVLCTSAGTTGLELILRWFGVGPGDEVIVPAYTYCATVNVIIHCGAKPVLIDSKQDHFNIDPAGIKKAITDKTKVIMPVDIGGFPADYDEIFEIVTEKKILNLFSPKDEIQESLGRILILDDAAHSLGASYQGKDIGSVADISVFSFHAVKNLTTGEGGAIAMKLPANFNHEKIYSELNIMSLHGQSKDALAKTKKGNWKYDVIMPGYKANMTDIQASMGLVELNRYRSDTLKKRKKITDYYNEAFESEAWAETPLLKQNGSESSYHLYQLRIKNISEKQRDRIIQDIFENEVSVNVHFQPVPLFKYYREKGYDINNYPAAYNNFKREISLPVYYDLTDDQVKTVTETVKSSVTKILEL